MSIEQIPRLTLDAMGLRAVKELKPGDVIFPGLGIPMDAILPHIPQEFGISVISENGIAGHGQILTNPAEWEQEASNPGGHPVAILPWGCYTSQLDIFIALGGRHCIDVTFLGAFQVSEKGDLANWMALEKGTSNLGGAMDTAVGAKKLVVLMKHIHKDGSMRIVKECNQPITAKGVVDLIITDMAVIEVTQQGLFLKEIVPGISVEELQSLTEPKLIVSDKLCPVTL